jgi:hypothetical protein
MSTSSYTRIPGVAVAIVPTLAACGGAAGEALSEGEPPVGTVEPPEAGSDDSERPRCWEVPVGGCRAEVPFEGFNVAGGRVTRR